MEGISGLEARKLSASNTTPTNSSSGFVVFFLSHSKQLLVNSPK
jgi:hypothetical protein